MKQESFWYQEMLQISKEKLFYPRILYQEKFYFWNSRTQKKTSPSLFIRVLLKVIIQWKVDSEKLDSKDLICFLKILEQFKEVVKTIYTQIKRHLITLGKSRITKKSI